MEGQGRNMWKCEGCAEEAKFFCRCRERETVMCSRCFLRHAEEGKGVRHHMEPIAAYRAPGYYSRLQARSLIITDVKSQAYRSLAQVDNAIQALTHRTESLIAALQQHCDEVLAWLTKLKYDLQVEVNKGIEEVERTLFDDNPTMMSEMGRTIRTYVDRGCTDFDLFTYQLNETELQPQKFISLHCFPGSMPRLTKFPLVTDSHLHLLDVFSLPTSSYPLPFPTHTNSVFCLLNDSTFLHISTPQPIVSLYFPLNSTYKTLPNTIETRFSPGIFHHSDQVYLFGGKNTHILASNEKLSLKNENWTEISRMSRPRFAFTPCFYENFLYLVDTNTASEGKIDTFSLISEEICTLDLVLPAEMLTNCCSVSIISDKMLILMSNKVLGVWKMSDLDGKMSVTSGNFQCFSHCPPLIVGREAFFSYFGRLLRFDINQLRLESEKKDRA